MEEPTPYTTSPQPDPSTPPPCPIYVEWEEDARRVLDRGQVIALNAALRDPHLAAPLQRWITAAGRGGLVRLAEAWDIPQKTLVSELKRCGFTFWIKPAPAAAPACPYTVEERLRAHEVVLQVLHPLVQELIHLACAMRTRLENHGQLTYNAHGPLHDPFFVAHGIPYLAQRQSATPEEMAAIREYAWNMKLPAPAFARLPDHGEEMEKAWCAVAATPAPARRLSPSEENARDARRGSKLTLVPPAEKFPPPDEALPGLPAEIVEPPTPEGAA